MTKKELVEKIAQKTELTKTAAEKAIKAFEEAVKESLKSNDSVRLVGFGTFEVAQRNERKGRNPQTGQVINIPARKVPRFKAGKSLRVALN